ncbi:hypothetical protein ACHQM5_007593 [Ranunculus cassubicifolius]
MKRLTGLQKQILGLYRGFLRASRTKSPEERKKIEAIVSQQFHQNAISVDSKNFIYIEYLLRRGSKQLEQLQSPATVSMFTVAAPLKS